MKRNGAYIAGNKFPRLLMSLVSLCLALIQLEMAHADVTVTEVMETIPTYLSGPPEPNPMFFFGQGTQGAEQRIYPYPLFDNLTHQKADKDYRLVYLENEYVRIAISPELGGRLFSGVDKTNALAPPPRAQVATHPRRIEAVTAHTDEGRIPDVTAAAAPSAHSTPSSKPPPAATSGRRS